MSQLIRKDSVIPPVVGSITEIVPNVGPDVFPDGLGLVAIGGGANITTDGTLPNTLEIRVSGTTDHAVQIGNATGSLGSLAVGATGTLLVGATGADPAFATSAVGDFSFTNATAATPRVLTVENDDTDPGSYAALKLSAEPLGGDAFVFFEIDTATQYYSAGIDNSVAGDPWKLTNSTSPSGGDAIISTTNAGVITLFNDLDVSEGGTGVSTLTSHGILMGNGAGDIQATAEPSDGQILIGKTGDFPQLTSLTAGSNIIITPGAGTISIAATVTDVAWAAVAADAGLTVNTGTIANKAGLLSMTLPATAALGDILEFTNINTAVGLRIAQNANQAIRLSGSLSTTGVGGYVETTQLGDSLKLICTVAGASTRWTALSMLGNWTIA